MFIKNENEKYCVLHCSCGCNSGVLLRAEKDEDFGSSLSLVSDVYYTIQQTAWSKFTEKCKRIWAIIRNKEYCYFDICIDNEDLKEFKAFVAEI